MGFKTRCGFDGNAKDEEASLFHAAKELRNTKNHILSLKIGNEVVSDEKAIKQEVLGFFGALFNGHHNASLQNTGTPFVPSNTHLDVFLDGLTSMCSESSDKLDEDVDIEELDCVIKQCPNNKSPGIDGINYEFYKRTQGYIF